MSLLDVQVGQLPISSKELQLEFLYILLWNTNLMKIEPILEKHKVCPHKPMIFCMTMPSSWFMLWDLWYGDLLECVARIDRYSTFEPCFAELLATLNAYYMVQGRNWGLVHWKRPCVALITDFLAYLWGLFKIWLEVCCGCSREGLSIDCCWVSFSPEQP